MNKKKLTYNLLDSPLLQWSFFISVKLWKKLCLKKHELAKELNIYDNGDL